MFTFKRLVTTNIRNHSSLRPPYNGTTPNGFFFFPVKSEGKLEAYHPLDNGPEYLRFLKDDLPREIMDDISANCRPHIVELMNYNIPLFPICWTFIPELIYMKAVPKEKQTPEGFKKMRIVRACFDCKWGGYAIFDDIMDKSNKRQGRITWEYVAPRGQSGAISGASFLLYLPNYLMMKYFRGTPTYPLMMDVLMNGDFLGMLGGVMDINGQGGSRDKNLDSAFAITKHKAGALVGVQCVLAMHSIGIVDPVLEKNIYDFQDIFGEFIQVWDDFSDYYCTPEETGKPSRDFANGSTTWASGIAMTLFNEEQKRIFHENYGSPDPEKQEIVRKLYDNINLSEEYVKYFKSRSRDCYAIIQEMAHPGIREALMSYFDWMIGDLDLQSDPIY